MAAFALSDQHGARFGNAELAGKPSLAFFGFTHCPDVCPTTLAMLAQLQRDADLAALRLIFVTVDPGRDDQRDAAALCGGLRQRFHRPAWRGCSARTAAEKPRRRTRWSSRSPAATTQSTIPPPLFYINAKGEFSAVFTPPFDHTRLRNDLVALIASHY